MLQGCMFAVRGSVEVTCCLLLTLYNKADASADNRCLYHGYTQTNSSFTEGPCWIRTCGGFLSRLLSRTGQVDCRESGPDMTAQRLCAAHDFLTATLVPNKPKSCVMRAWFAVLETTKLSQTWNITRFRNVSDDAPGSIKAHGSATIAVAHHGLRHKVPIAAGSKSAIATSATSFSN